MLFYKRYISGSRGCHFLNFITFTARKIDLRIKNVYFHIFTIYIRPMSLIKY